MYGSTVLLLMLLDSARLRVRGRQATCAIHDDSEVAMLTTKHIAGNKFGLPSIVRGTKPAARLLYSKRPRARVSLWKFGKPLSLGDGKVSSRAPWELDEDGHGRDVYY